jgi:hypothetical protein
MQTIHEIAILPLFVVIMFISVLPSLELLCYLITKKLPLFKLRNGSWLSWMESSFMRTLFFKVNPKGQSQDPVVLRRSLTAVLPLSLYNKCILDKIKTAKKLYFNGSWLSCDNATPDVHPTRPFSFASHSRECFAIFISVPFV